VLEEFFIL